MIEVKDVSKAILVAVRIPCIRDIRALSAEKADKDGIMEIAGDRAQPFFIVHDRMCEEKEEFVKGQDGTIYI